MTNYFRYATVSEIEAKINEDLILEALITEADFLDAIEDASAMINAWTGQIFNPCPENVRVSSRASKVLKHPKYYPFLDIFSIEQIENRTTGEFREGDRIVPGLRNYSTRRALSGYGYSGSYKFDNMSLLSSGSNQIAVDRGKRTVSLISLLGNIASGFRNVQFKGWFGWLENLKGFKTTLSQSILAGNTVQSINVSSVMNNDSGDYLNVGDVINIVLSEKDGFAVSSESAIVQQIINNGPDYTLIVDTTHSYPFDIPIDANVCSFGRVPKAISEVAQFLAARIIAKKIGAILGGPQEAQLLGNIISETTDNYSYKLADVFGAVNDSGNTFGKYTGNTQMDLLLREFMQPNLRVTYI